MRAWRVVLCSIVVATQVVACTKAKPEPSPTTPASGFVARDGTGLVLDGRPFRFHGLNYYDINSITGENPYHPGTQMLRGCRGNFRVPRLDESLARIGRAANGLRAWFYQPQATAIPLAGGAPMRDWSVFDRTLAAVKAAGMRIVVVLGETNGRCDLRGVRRDTVDWYRSRFRTEIPPDVIASYRDYVSEIVTRYRNRTEILAWQLLNEPGAVQPDGTCNQADGATALRSFADEMGGLIKRLDPNHLVSLGTGMGSCGQGSPFQRHYRKVHASPGIDLCEFHDYKQPATPLPQALVQLLQICSKLRKPLFVGEMGIEKSDVSGRCPRPTTFTAFTECRRRLLDAKFQAQVDATAHGAAGDVAGILVWNWCDPAWTHCQTTRHDILPGDPTLAALAALPTS